MTKRGSVRSSLMAARGRRARPRLIAVGNDQNHGHDHQHAEYQRLIQVEGLIQVPRSDLDRGKSAPPLYKPGSDP